MFPLLFSPFRLGQREAPNRIVSTSHGTNYAEGGTPGERLIAYHVAKAAGGCGTVMMFGSAAASRTLKECGFDGADLAFYDDQLPDQFWDPSINKRTDEYGGTLENRMRFSLEVLEAIRGAVGRDFIVGARVSGDDYLPEGLGP